MTDLRQDIWTWWGLARRREYAPLPEPSRLELASLLVLGALLVDTLWLIVLSLLPAGYLTRGTLGAQLFAFYFPLGIALLPLALGFLVSPRLWQGTSLSAVVALAREAGWLARWDRALALLACGGLVLGGFFRQLELVYWPAVLIVCALALASAFGLQRFKPAPLQSRKWQMTVPEWIKVQLKPTQADQPEALPEPDPNANARYEYTPFESGGGAFPVGIRIDEESVLKPLRAWNTASQGQLYHTEPLAVVLSQGKPAEGLGTAEIDRLCAQLAQIAKAKRLTRYQFAESILGFVQAAIQYEPDAPSTQRLLNQAFAEYGRFPAETLYDGVGDCECTAILCAALLARSGFPCALLQMELSPRERHMALGLKLTEDLFISRDQNPFIGGGTDLARAVVTEKSGDRYLYGETAIDQGKLGFGVIPPEWRERVKVNKLIPILPPTKT